MASRVQYNATWSHGPVSGPLNGLLGALFITLLGRVLIKFGVDFPLWLPLALALNGIIAAWIVGWQRRTAGKNIAFRAGCWAFAGVWSTFTIHYGWSIIGGVVIVGGAMFAGLLAPVFAPYVEAPVVTYQPDPDGGMAGDIAKLIIKFGGIKPEDRPTVRKLKDWTPSDAGSTWIVTGAPGTRFSWRTLRDIQGDLAAGLCLPDGCPVQAEGAGTTQNEAKLHVSTRNYLKDPIDYPLDFSELTITEEFSVGRFLDATPTLIELYQASGLVAGQRGGGKTVLLHNITASLVRCRDVVVWHIDLNGGGLSAPWMTPYALGEVQTSAIDWIATSTAEAMRMAQAALRIATDRKAKYAGLLVSQDADVLQVTPNLPLIMIIVDESAEVTGEDAKEALKVSKALQKVQRIGRAMCVNVFFSTLRATGDYIPAGLKKQSSLAFCTRVKDESELAQVFDWHKGIKPEDLTEPGQMFIQRGQDPVKMFKGFRLKPAGIARIVVGVEPIRARVGLDARALAAAGALYRDRWDSPCTQAFMAGLRGEADLDDAVFDDLDTVDQDDDVVGGPDDVLDTFRSTVADARKAATSTPKKKAAPSAPDSTMSSARVDEVLAALEHLPTVEPERPWMSPPASTAKPAAEPVDDDVAEDKGGPAARSAFILDLLDEAGDEGMATGDIVDRVIAAGLGNPDRPQGVREHLTKRMRDRDKTITQYRNGKQELGRWWAV